MDGNDFNLITPVNSLQTFGPLSDVERRKQWKRKGKQKRETETENENVESDGDGKTPPPAAGDSPHRLDFQA